MSFRLPRAAAGLACLISLLLFASSCASSGSDDSLASAVEADVSGLLPSADAEPTGAVVAQNAPATTPPQPTQPAAVIAAPVDPPLPDNLSCLSTRTRVAQLLLPLATQPELIGAQVFAADGELGGIGLLGEPDAALAEILTQLQQSSFVPIMVASDEEGGSVQRLANLLGPIQSAAATAQSKAPDDVRKQWVEYGSRVRALGIDVVFGPVLDVGAGPGIESRSFGDDPAVVAAYGAAVADGLLEAGVMPVFKHFPGHGRATGDSHLGLPTTPDISELRQLDLVPYVELLADPVYRDQAAVMIGHLSVPGLSGELPTSLSPETVTGLLRTELGFGGLVFTDALNMGAIVDTYGRLDALELAILAGADIAILGSLADLTPALDHLVMRFESDPAFAAVVNNRAARVIAAKAQETLCTGAQG